jgi:DNA-binding HxlR family transcriptional regulator
MRRRHPSARSSPLRAALDRVGDRWLLLIVETLADGPLRFGEIGERVGAASNILTDRLRRLEGEGLVVATPYSDRPVRVTYDLTASGRELAVALGSLAEWGAVGEGGRAERFHDVCGTAIELRPWCPTCERVVGPAETDGTYDL